MIQQETSHTWEMVNVVPGFIITEKCFHCEKISTYFSNEDRPPFEEYREDQHFWNVMESAQSISFDLTCTTCGSFIQYKELLGMMMCTGCDENCEVDRIRRTLEPELTWIYVAFGFLPIKERKQLSPEQFAILEEYYNQRRKSSRSKIKIVSHELIKNISTCYAEVIKDVDMLSLTPR